MNVCIFGASSSITKEHYIRSVEELGRILAERGHALIFGAGGAGLMGAAARGFKAGGGRVTGIVDARSATKEEVGLMMTRTEKREEEGR